MVKTLISNDIQAASKHLKSYITQKSQQILEQDFNQSLSSDPFVVSLESDGNIGRLEIYFVDGDVAQAAWDDMVKIVDQTFKKFNAVDTNYDGEVSEKGSVWIFNAEPSQHERIKQVIEQQLTDLVEQQNVEDEPEFDDYDAYRK